MSSQLWRGIHQTEAFSTPHILVESDRCVALKSERQMQGVAHSGPGRIVLLCLGCVVLAWGSVVERFVWFGLVFVEDGDYAASGLVNVAYPAQSQLAEY